MKKCIMSVILATIAAALTVCGNPAGNNLLPELTLDSRTDTLMVRELDARLSNVESQIAKLDEQTRRPLLLRLLTFK